MNVGDLFISPFITILAFLFKSLATLPEQIPGLNTVLTVTLFALLIRLITISFVFQQRRSMEKDGELQQRLVELRRRYANDSEKLTQAQITLYQEMGINPLSGCLSTLIQLPFIFGLYSAITVAFGGSPYQLFDLHGRVLLPNLSDIIPFPGQFLWLNLAQPDFVLAILVTVTAFMERRLAKKGQADLLGIYIIPLALGILSATSFASGVSIFLIVLYLTNMAVYVAMESVGLRRLFLGREKTRRWELQQALKQNVITAKRFDQLMTGLLQPPELSQEDITLAVKFLELGASSFRGWPAILAEKAGKVLARLSMAGKMPYDLGDLYSKFSECCFKLDYKEQAINLAVQGYDCPQNKPESKIACVLLLAHAEFVDQRAKTIYKVFVTEHTPGSIPVQKFARIFQDKGVITTEMDAATVRQRIPLNLCIAEFLPDQPYHWAKSNLGLAYLILDELEKACRYFQEMLAIDPIDAVAVQGLSIIWFRLEKYDQSIQVIHAARQAGLSEKVVDAIEGFSQAASWLADVSVDISVLNRIEGWYPQLQSFFPIRRFLATEAVYIQGRLAGIVGDWANAYQHLQAAYNADRNNLKFAYHYAQSLQISGQWELASKVLKDKKADSIELLCLVLKQASHDTGLDQLNQELLQFANDLNAETLKKRLTSAKHAILAGRAADIPAWPAQLAFETPEQADEWVAIWLSALIARGAANEIRQEMDSKRYLRLPRPEQLFLAATAKWLSRDLVGAEKDLRESLKLVPNYENVLRLLAAILEDRGDTIQAYPLLERLQRVSPNDHITVLRVALLRWQKGEEKEAIAQLQRLISDPKIGPLAKFWAGRLFLIRAAKSHDHQDLQQASQHFKWAVEAGIPDAPWYVWLCEARKEHNSNTGWGRREAAYLIKKLPGPWSAIPVAEVATVAALVAIETNDPADMLAGCTIMLNRLQNQPDKKATNSVSLKNWTEALWRTAEAVTSLNDRLALSRLAHQVGDAFPEHGRVARQVADAMVMSTITDLTQSGENADVVLTQVEAAIEMTPNALIPRLARTSLLIKRGEMTAQEAVTYLSRESQPIVAQALEECVQLTTDSQSTSTHPSGMAAFLTANKASLPNLVSTLQTLSVQAIDWQDDAFLLEMARCMAAVDIHDDAIALFSRAYGAGHAPTLAKEFSDYLCHVVVRSGVTDTAKTIVDLEKAQQLLYLARTYCLEGVQ